MAGELDVNQVFLLYVLYSRLFLRTSSWPVWVHTLSGTSPAFPIETEPPND